MDAGGNTRARIAVLASGSGSNAEALMAHFASGSGSEVGEVVWVCTNRRAAGVRERAIRLGIPESHVSRLDMEAGRLLEELRARKVEWVALAGFLLRVPAPVCAEFECRMVNIHPALLPDYGGEGMYGMNVHRAVHQAGETGNRAAAGNHPTRRRSPPGGHFLRALGLDQNRAAVGGGYWLILNEIFSVQPNSFVTNTS